MHTPPQHAPAPARSLLKLNREFPLSADWTDVLHPSGHASRARSDWLAAYAQSRLAAQADPWLAAAIALSCSSATHGIQACSIFCAIASASPETLMIFNPAQGERARAAFFGAQRYFECASAEWRPSSDPALRGWSPLNLDSDVQANARKSFASMARRAGEFSSTGPFAALMARALPLDEDSPCRPHVGPSWRSRHGALLGLAGLALAHPCSPPFSIWAREHSGPSLTRALLTLDAKPALSFAEALFPDAAQRAAALGIAFSEALSMLDASAARLLRKDIGQLDLYFLASSLSEQRCVFFAGLARFCSAASQADSPMRPHLLRFWTTFIPLPWERAAFEKTCASLAACSVDQAPPLRAAAVFSSLASEAASMPASNQALSTISQYAWLAMECAERDSRYPEAHAKLALAIPSPAMEARSLARCPPAMASSIEKSSLGACSALATTSAGRPRI